VTHLRQIMLEELRRRNFAATTIRSYIHGVEHFSRYFHRPPDQLGPEDIRKYQAMLFTQLKFSPNTVILRLAALRFFYIHVLKRGWSIAETPYPKKVRHLPQVLSQEEVARLMDAAESPFHRILLMRPNGCFPATDGIPQVIPSPPRSSGRPARTPLSVPAWRTSTSIRTRYATASPPTCWRPEPTCAPSRYCSVIATSK
jgi:hypothetical protein